MARILIAEDDAGVRHLVSRALGLEGHDVTLAEDGEMALEALIAADGAFDFVLSDIRMPAMTGIELAHEIAASWPELPVLLMTGFAEQMEAAEELTAIIEGVLEKPFSIGEIRREVGRILAARQGAKSASASVSSNGIGDIDDHETVSTIIPIRRCA